MPTKSYEIPRFGLPNDRILGWCLEAQQEGDAWLSVQKPSRTWNADIELLSSPDGASDVDGLSNTGYNKSKRVARELVASLANFRHEGEFATTWNNQLYNQASTLTNLDRNWYSEGRANDAHRAVLQYGVGKGTGYFYEVWDPYFHSPYRGDIRLSAVAPEDVTFIQLPKSHDIQRAYAVIIREEMPINVAKAVYARTNPEFAAQLVPDRDAPGWVAKGLRKVQQFLAPALRVAGRLSGQSEQASFPTVDIFHMYTLDSSVNDAPFPIPMGKPGTNWFYNVPALGDPIQTFERNPTTGNFFTRPAEAADCKMFPFRRYTIFSRTGIGYDGTSMWWHGQVPLARVRFNDWAWEALGASLVGELRTMQIGIEGLMRGIEDAAAARLNPPAIYNDSLVSSTWAKAFNPRLAGTRAGGDLNSGQKLIEFPVDAEWYNVPTYIPEFIKAQEDRMDYISGVRDLVAVAKAQQIPGADTLEKLLEMAGPIVQDLVRQVEEPLRQLGEWRKAYYFQFYTTERMITITGPDGVPEDVQYAPDTLMPWYRQYTPEQIRLAALRSLDDFKYRVTESGINEIHRMTTKLFYLQLMKEGFPISWWTFARIAQIPNFGPVPEGTNNELERYIAQQRIQIDLEVDKQLEMQRQMQMQGMIAPGGTPGNAPGGEPEPAAGGEPGGPPQKGAGRPNTYSKPPRLQQKDGGTRTTVATS